MPLDKDTLDFLVNETIETALTDTREKLEELSMKYKLKIRVTPPLVLEIIQQEQGEVIWEKK